MNQLTEQIQFELDSGGSNLKALLDPAIENYAVTHSSRVDSLLHELRDHTHAHVEMPQMQVGPLEGQFLRILAKMIGAKRIVEVGTFTGYSALMLASALPDDGRLWTLDINLETTALARRYWDRSEHGHKIQELLGPALESLEQLEGPFDMAFIDADKDNYSAYFHKIYPRMRKGGLIVVDNVLWSGRVLDPQSEQSASTRAIADFNRMLAEWESLDKVMLTVRDGMTLILV